MSIVKCPHCNNTILDAAQENLNEIVVKVRMLIYHKGGDLVSGKCPKCKGMVKIPSLKPIN